MTVQVHFQGNMAGVRGGDACSPGESIAFRTAEQDIV